MEFRLLGPVELRVGGRAELIGPPKERCVLAVLLLAGDRAVSAETLMERVWEEGVPPSARQTLHSYIARLRGRLRDAVGDAARIVYRSGSYALETARENVDLERFRESWTLARAMMDSGAHEEAARLLREADQLWGDEPLAQLPGDWIARQRVTLEVERLEATQLRMQAELLSGNNAGPIKELPEIIARHPDDEKLVEYLMIALYRAGRPAQALETYRETRTRIVEQHGVEPAGALQELHQRMLRGDPDLAGSVARPAAREPAHNNLQPDIPNFVGREREMRWLEEALGGDQPDAAVGILAIDGMPGVGKSALALHLAHRLRPRYPDAHLFLDLRAHNPDQPPADPADALRTLLRIVGLEADTGAGERPQPLEVYTARWRTWAASRRVLLVLDDAAGAEQIGPLLPGTPGCLVLATSRRRLAGLSAARSLSLDPLPRAEAASLFASVAGREPVATGGDEGGAGGDEDPVERIVELCDRVPLAIHLAAERLRVRPSWTIRDLAERLARSQRRLAEIDTDSRPIQAAYELSYRGLTEPRQRAFRALAQHPGADVDVYATAALTGLDYAGSERLLDGLMQHHFIEEPAPGRFRFHELIRAYGRDVAQRDGPAGERDGAVGRLLRYYLHTADRADRLRDPDRRRLPLDAGEAPAEAPPLAGERDATAWLAAERANLLGAAHHAADHGWVDYAVQLPHVLAHFLEEHGSWGEAAAVHERAIALWRERGDEAGKAQALYELGMVRWLTGDYQVALRCAQEALAIRHSLGDHSGVAAVSDHIGLVYLHSARYHEALASLQEALTAYSLLGNRRGEAEALLHIGNVSWHLGRYRDAIERFRSALVIYHEVSDRSGQVKALNNAGDVHRQVGHYHDALGYFREALRIGEGSSQAESVLIDNIGRVWQDLGRYEEALDHHRRALDMHRSRGDRRCEADALNNVGTTYQKMRHPADAADHHQQALAIAQQIAEPFEQAKALGGIGDAHAMSGLVDSARWHYRRAMEIARAIGDRYEHGRALAGLGGVEQHAGDLPEARACLEQALLIFEQLGVPDAETVRTRLRSSDLTG